MFTITIQRNPISVAFEVGSISEAIGILEQEDTQIRKIATMADGFATGTALTSGTVETEAVTEPTKGKRGPKPKDKTQPDPSTASAPPPAPIPAAPELVAQNEAAAATGDIPPYLKNQAAAAPPPPPPPPAAPVAPPSGILAGKVIANLDQRKAGTADNGKSLADWLVQYGLVNAGSSYDESVAALRLMQDDKLSQVAGALGVA